MPKQRMLRVRKWQISALTITLEKVEYYVGQIDILEASTTAEELLYGRGIDDSM